MGFAVVEILQTGGLVEGLFDVAFFAIGAQVVVVSVFVAAVAIAEFQTGELLERLAVADFFLVAFDAIDGLVLAFKTKFCLVVIKPARRSKGIGSVAFGTIIRQGFLMVIRMAGQAFLLEPKEGSPEVFQAPVFNVVRLMALPAVRLFMRAFEFVTGQFVFEIVLIESDHIEIPAMVITVTGGAAF